MSKRGRYGRTGRVGRTGRHGRTGRVGRVGRRHIRGKATPFARAGRRINIRRQKPSGVTKIPRLFRGLTGTEIESLQKSLGRRRKK